MSNVVAVMREEMSALNKVGREKQDRTKRLNNNKGHRNSNVGHNNLEKVVTITNDHHKHLENKDQISRSDHHNNNVGRSIQEKVVTIIKDRKGQGIISDHHKTVTVGRNSQEKVVINLRKKKINWYKKRCLLITNTFFIWKKYLAILIATFYSL